MWKRLKIFVCRLFDVYCREFRIVLHDEGIMLFCLFLPLAYPVLYSLIYNPEVVRDVKMVVVDHDRSQKSRELVRSIDATEQAWVIGYAADMPEARKAVNSHECYGILEIPEGFGKRLGNNGQANAVMYCEASLLLRYRSFLMATTNVMAAMGAELMTEKINDVAPLAGTVVDGDLMPIESVEMGNIESGFDTFIMPGVLILILHQCIILATGMAGGAKREYPEMMGYITGKVKHGIVVSMLGEMLCYITVLVIPTIFLVHYVPLIFAFPMENHITDILAFLLPMALACFGVGFCFQGLVKERETVFVIWVVTSLIFLFLSGLTWPRYAMSPFWHFVSSLIPATWGVEGFIRMNTNGATLAQVHSDYVALWILAAVYLAAGYCVQRWVVRPSLIKGYDAYASVRARCN